MKLLEIGIESENKLFIGKTFARNAAKLVLLCTADVRGASVYFQHKQVESCFFVQSSNKTAIANVSKQVR